MMIFQTYNTKLAASRVEPSNSLHFTAVDVMFLRYYELKKMLYFAQAIMGVLLVLGGVYEYGKIDTASPNLTNYLTGLICMFSGGALIFFAVETYLLRDDSDIWR
jgi:hypothetical protein